MRLALAAAVAVALLAVLPAGSATRPASPALIKQGLARAVAAGRLTPDEAAGYRAEVARAQAEAAQAAAAAAPRCSTACSRTWRRCAARTRGSGR